jgi:hypothetical protein
MFMGLISDFNLTNPSQGELEHRRAKRFYVRTSKNQHERQITRLERRERALLRIETRKRKEQNPASATPTTNSKRKKGLKPNMNPRVDFTESEALPYTAPEQHHHISASRNFPVNLTRFLAENHGDPATKVSFKHCPIIF